MRHSVTRVFRNKKVGSYKSLVGIQESQDRFQPFR
jgi:hypothetical protein